MNNQPTEKQIAYAAQIKEDRIAKIKYIASDRSAKAFWKTSHASGATPEFDADAIIDMIVSMTVIETLDSKNKNIADIYAEYVSFKFPVWVDNTDADPFGFDAAGEWVYE